MKKILASALIALIALNGSLPALHAHAGEPKSSDPTYSISLDVPNRGLIDLRHGAFDSRDSISSALYVLRNTAIEDLLNTRRSLKILLGGTDRARQVSRQSDLGFEVPGG